MKCQIMFSGKNKSNINNLSSAKLTKRVIKVKGYQCLVLPSLQYNEIHGIVVVLVIM